jgi:hypothetical protein
MTPLEIMFAVLGLVMTVFSIWLAIHSNHNARNAPYDQRRDELRAELRGRLYSQWRLLRTVKHLDRGLPGSPVEADLEELRDYLNAKMHRFLVPRPEHIEVLVRSIDDALAALAVAQHPPRNDTVFIPHVDEIKCNVLRPWLERTLADVNLMLDGLAQLERQPRSEREQVELFAALEPSNRTPIEV